MIQQFRSPSVEFGDFFVFAQRNGIAICKINGNLIKCCLLVRLVCLEQYYGTIISVTDTLKATHIFLFLSAVSGNMTFLARPPATALSSVANKSWKRTYMSIVTAVERSLVSILIFKCTTVTRIEGLREQCINRMCVGIIISMETRRWKLLYQIRSLGFDGVGRSETLGFIFIMQPF